MQTIFKFSAPIRPISMNMAVRHGRNGSYKSTALKTFWKEIEAELSKTEAVKVNHSPVEMIIHYTLPREEYFTQEGAIAKRHDLDNLLKYTVDAVAKYLGFNDAIINKLISVKVPGERWYINIELRQEKA